MLEYKWNLPSAQDIATNILGFIPFGFFFSAWLLKNARLKRLQVYLIIAVLGTGLSFAIELIQIYLPTILSVWLLSPAKKEAKITG